ncbi:FAD binding domain-containing protein [Dyella choica]|uniref:2,6-dihydroxypyridine 3-monooxygenase substrate binding domain-containing protein n=1 Tax=Dyella choica TaxID=1927959 RepID=A0A3S0PR35_9GAMM|nr:FAD binding domain-containing protein [Dyella choica]RUL78991.1 hypothetical protein EKH80_04120 [Dyella choica]
MPRALIIGGSLGGLFTAIALRAIGWEVQVFERSPSELSSRGGGIVLQPDVIAAFRFAGVEHGHMLGVRSGDRIYLDREDRVTHRSYMPQTQTSWNMLYATMSRSLPDGVVHRSEEFVRLEQDGTKVRAHFSSGRMEEGDLLVGADGPGSSLRALLIDNIHPRYAGYVAFRGLLPEQELSGSASDKLMEVFAFQQGADHLLLEYLVPGLDESTLPGHRRWNWVWYRKVAAGEGLTSLMRDRHGRQRTFSLPPGAMKDSDIHALRTAARELLAPTFQELLERTVDPFAQAILDLQVPQMVFGRAVLLGDAAFIPRPHTAGSTAKAATNAIALARALDKRAATIEQCLAEWEAEQLQLGTRMTEWGIAMGDKIMDISSSRSALHHP